MGSILAQATANGSSDDLTGNLIGILAFGGGALLVLTGVYWFRRRMNATFARMYGLVLVAVLAVALAFADVQDEARTAAFALLGTIAGYLAGAKTQTQPAAPDGGAPPAPAAGQVETYL